MGQTGSIAMAHTVKYGLDWVINYDSTQLKMGQTGSVAMATHSLKWARLDL